MSTYTIYMHTNKVNGKVYIGQTCQPLEDRWRKDGAGYVGSTKFYNAIKKYGWDNFEHVILFSDLTQEQANRLEEKLIEEYNATDDACGYNIQKGGGNHQIPQETRDKISRTKLSQHNHMPEERRHWMRENYRGEGNPFYGKTHSKETREKMSRNHANVKGGNNPCAKKVMCVETGVIYPSAREACEAVGRSKSAITNCCSGRSQTCAGYHWVYKED